MIGCIPGVKKVKSHLIVDLKIGDVCVKTHIPGLESKHIQYIQQDMKYKLNELLWSFWAMNISNVKPQAAMNRSSHPVRFNLQFL